MRISKSREDHTASSPDAVLRALADPHRRRILKLVQDHELAAGQIASRFESLSKISQHLRLLESAGLLRVRQEGTRRLYMLQPESLETVRKGRNAHEPNHDRDSDNHDRGDPGGRLPVLRGGVGLVVERKS